MALAPAEIFIFRPRPFDRFVFSTRFQNHPPTSNLPVTCVKSADWRRRGEHGSGEESCVAWRKGFALPVCKPPPGCRPGGGQVVPVVVSGCRCRPFSPDFAGNTPAAGVLSFPYCPNMVRNVPNFASFQSFAKLLPPDLVKFSVFAGFGCPRSASNAVCRMVTAWRPGIAAAAGRRLSVVRPGT